jgi:hypothetical protein
MKSKILLFALAGILLVGSVALADTFNPIGGEWTNLVASNEGGTPFWANPSNDGDNKNVGFQILGLSVPNPQYWSISGGVDNNVTFAGAGGGKPRPCSLRSQAMPGTMLFGPTM